MKNNPEKASNVSIRSQTRWRSAFAAQYNSSAKHLKMASCGGQGSRISCFHALRTAVFT
jgi:hypothetical protein